MSARLNWNDLVKKKTFGNVLERVWCSRLDEGESDWHAYGQSWYDGRVEEDGDMEESYDGGKRKKAQTEDPKRLLLFVDPECDVSDLWKSFTREFARDKEFREECKLTKDRVDRCVPLLMENTDVVRIEHFQQLQPGTSYRSSTLLRPGARVFSTSARIGDSTNGTIGAFLRPKPTPETRKRPPLRSRAWLLSNKHILLQQNQNVQEVEVRGAGNTLISRQVDFVGLEARENQVDAAIAEVADPREIEAFYDGIPINCPDPISPRPGMRVQKLGNATGVTEGTIICQVKNVFVADARKGGGFLFKDQWLIGSSSTFMANGDSGSLVVGENHPVALLFAMAETVHELPKKMRFIPPFGLACSIQQVLHALRDQVDGTPELEIMLDRSIKRKCRIPGHFSDPQQDIPQEDAEDDEDEGAD